MISLMRSQRMHDEALEIALKLVRLEPTSVRARIAAALCLVDKGDWHSAKSILEELIKSDKNDPRFWLYLLFLEFQLMLKNLK